MKAFTLVSILGLAALVISAAPPTTSQPVKEPCTIRISAPVEVALGMSVAVTIRLTNTSGSDLNASMSYERGLDMAYGYDIRRIDGGMSTQMQPHFPAARVSSDIARTLKPGESGQAGTDLGEIFHLSPGKYSVQLSREVSDASGHPMGVVKSNTIAVTIVPPPFTIEISTPSAEVKAGSPIPLNVRLANTSTGEIPSVPVITPGAVDPSYSYLCNNSTGRPVGDQLLGGRNVEGHPVITLRPGQKHDEVVSLSSACDLRQAGQYRIRLARADASDPKHRFFYSNEITVTVKP
jgi:hypothetical protein